MEIWERGKGALSSYVDTVWLPLVAFGDPDNK